MSSIEIDRPGRYDVDVLQLELSEFRFDRQPASVAWSAEARLDYALTLECGDCRDDRRMYVAEARLSQTLRGQEVVTAEATFVFVLAAPGRSTPPSADDGRHVARTAIWSRFVGLVGQTNGSTSHPVPPLPPVPSLAQEDTGTDGRL